MIGLVLQKQLPSSQVPRFNPHPPEAPPQLRKPELVSKAYSPSKVRILIIILLAGLIGAIIVAQIVRSSLILRFKLTGSAYD